MSRMTPSQLLLRNLAGEIPKGRREYMSPEKALELLKGYTGQDFGYDLKVWKQWLKKHPERTWHVSMEKHAPEAD